MAIARGRSGGINRRYADGLKLAYKFPSFTNLATGSPFVSNRYGSPVPQNGGIATGTSGLQLPPTAFSAARLTIICQFVRNDFSFGENHLLTADSYGDGNRSFQFRLSGDTVQFIGFVGNVDKSAAGTFSAAYRDTPLTVGVVHDGATTTIFGSSLGVTSVLYSGTAINAPLDTDPAYIGIGCGWASATSQYDVVRSTTHRYLLAWDRPLTLDQVAYLVTDPERAFGNPRILYFPSAGGGATIAGSGTPTAQSSTVAGTAERSVTGTGTPTAQASAVAGVAERVITSSGTPTAQSSTVSGTGTVGGAFTGSGTLQAQSATVSGTAERSVTGTGAPASQAATVSGTAERVVTGTGTPTSQSSTVSGTGQVGNVVTGSGSPTAQAATVSGTAERTVTSSGALSAQSSTVAGTAERTITGSGALSAQSSTVYGFDSTPVDTGVRRIYPAGGARIDREINEWFQKNEDTAHAKRLMREDEELVLILLALAA